MSDPQVESGSRGMVNVQELYAEAKRLSSEAVVAAICKAEDELRQAAADSAAAQESLLAQLDQGLAEGVRAAAQLGARRATVLAFHGADAHEGFCYLHLLKGPRDPERQQQLGQHGFEPLLRRLRRQWAPFKVTHAWDQATNLNSVSVEW